MKRTTNPYDILNSFPNSRPYVSLDKEQEEKEAITKKYGVEVNRYIKEPYNIKIQFLDGFKKVWQDVISTKTGNQPKEWTGLEYEYKEKILKKDTVQKKLHNTLEKLDSYEAQLEKHSQEIGFSTEMSSADSLFKGMKSYHDTSFEGICDYVNHALHEFEVEAMGILDQ